MNNNKNKVVAYLETVLDKPVYESPSPVTLWLGGILRSVEEGKVSIEYTVRHDMSNPAGILHGGMSAAIIDDAIGIAVFSLGLEAFHATVNLSVDYLSSAAKGEQIIAKAAVVRKGSRLVNAECSIWGAAGNLIAKGTSNLISTNKVVEKRGGE